MTSMQALAVNPELDLVLERIVDVSPDRVWAAYTTPDLLKQWFCPKPWFVSECEIDLRPGGRFFTMMRSPEGAGHANEGCFLDVVPNRRLVWTDALHAGFRPVRKVETGAVDFLFTAAVSMEPAGTGTRYIAHVMHPDRASREKHDAMGFQAGWGAALDQLVALMRTG